MGGLSPTFLVVVGIGLVVAGAGSAFASSLCALGEEGRFAARLHESIRMGVSGVLGLTAIASIVGGVLLVHGAMRPQERPLLRGPRPSGRARGRVGAGRR